MSNTMTAASHEPTMHYLDSILNEEEKRCDQYSHQWRNFTISRSGRFRSKNRKRDTVDGKLFDSSSPGGKENDKISSRNTSSATAKSSSYSTNATTATGSNTSATTGTSSVRSQRDKTESYKSFYETSL